MLQACSSTELLQAYCSVLEILRERNVIRSSNNPVADYTEHLICEALTLTLAPKSTTGFDAHDEQNRKYEIKGRRITRHSKSRQLSAIRGLNEGHFSFLAGVVFNEDFTILKACLVPHAVVSELATYREHVNAWIFHLRDSVWEIPSVVDITGVVHAIQVKSGCTG